MSLVYAHLIFFTELQLLIYVLSSFHMLEPDIVIVCGLVVRVGHIWYLSVCFGMITFVLIQKVRTYNPEPVLH